MGGGSETTSSSSESSPWAPQGDMLQQIYQQALGLSQTPMRDFGRSTIAGQSAMTLESQQAGLGLIRGADGGDTRGYLEGVMRGDYLHPGSNPYVQNLADRGADHITRNFKRAAFPGTSLGAIGRTGSGAEMSRERGAYDSLGGALRDNYDNTYGREYSAERNRMHSGVGMMAGLNADRRADIGMGNALGQSADSYQQSLLTDIVNRFNFRQQEPGMRLDAFNRRILGQGTIPGITNTTGTQPGADFTAGQGIGAGLGLMSLFLGPAGIPGAMAGVAGAAMPQPMPHQY